MSKWLNDISRDINQGLYKKRQRSPSVVQRHKWHKEFLELGLDKRMSFLTYLKEQTKLWHRSKIGKKQHRQNTK